MKRGKIVILNAGGTILCDSEGGTAGLTDIRKQSLQERLRHASWHMHALPPDVEIEEWNLPCPPVLSEHASRAYWSLITSALNEIHQKWDEHLRGIVVCHGTDTLASFAPFLAASCGGPQYPVVIVASNVAPEKLLVAPLFDLYSDAGENLAAALLFLCDHFDLKGVFISFARRIMLPINIRKWVPFEAEADALAEHDLLTADDERASLERLRDKRAFVFHAVGVTRAVVAFLEASSLRLAWDKKRIQQTLQDLYPFSAKMSFRSSATRNLDMFVLGMSPFLPPLFRDSYLTTDGTRRQVLTMLKHAGVAAVLLAGYKSRTFPTQGSNSVRMFCELCEESHVAVFVAGRAGPCAGSATYGSAVQVPSVRRLTFMVPETATAYLAAVLTSLEARGTEGAVGSLPDGDAARKLHIQHTMEQHDRRLGELLYVPMRANDAQTAR